MTRKERAQALLNSLKKGTVSVSFYDIAWVLRADVLGKDVENVLLEKISSSQFLDGSWGGGVFYFHDRVINTLSVVVALAQLGKQELVDIEKAVHFLQEAIPKLLEEQVETIGFELTFPRLLQDAQLQDLDLPYDSEVIRHYVSIGAKKKGLVPKQLFTKQTTLLHSLEAFGEDELDYFEIVPFPNGSIGNSPAATAAYLMKVGVDQAPKSLEYLKSFSEVNWDIPSIYPFEIFEKAWVLYNFLHAGILESLDYKSHTDYLWEHWQKFNGASISNAFPIIDSDDSAVVYIVLKQTGYPVDIQVLEQFEEEQWFRCFDLERNPSISANIHLLEAFSLDKEYKRQQEVIEKILQFLISKRGEDGFWKDKWHISAHYTTAHMALAVKNIDQNLYNSIIEQYKLFIETEDYNNLSFEEKSYIAQALEEPVELVQESNTAHLWVDKGLYSPVNVIESLT